jgi:hypothetical protein
MRCVRAAQAARKTSGAEVRVLLEWVLDLPRVVEPEPVGQLDLGERLVDEALLAVFLRTRRRCS